MTVQSWTGTGVYRTTDTWRWQVCQPYAGHFYAPGVIPFTPFWAI